MSGYRTGSGKATAPPWFVPLVADPDRSISVLAFPHAGGGCATFADCAARLGPEVAMWGLNLPGRQARFGEPPVTDIGALVDAVAASLPGHVNRPYLLFGYCSGALSAFLVARAAAAIGLPAPRALVVASFPAPRHARPRRMLHTLPADRFWAEITSLGGFPSVLALQPEHREIFEPGLRADYEALAGFRYVPGPPLDVPVVAVSGTRDTVLTEGDMAGWAEETAADFRLERVEADHWLLEHAPAPMARIVEEACRR